MTELNVEECVLDVGVNPLDHLLLFLHHVGQLGKYSAKLDNGALDGVHGVGPGAVVFITLVLHVGLHSTAHVNGDGSTGAGLGLSHIVFHGQN